MSGVKQLKQTFSNRSTLLKRIQTIHKPVLLIIPAISVGRSGLNEQYKDYLDQSAKLYTFISSHNIPIDIFVLGAEHRGDGFLHQVGIDYLINTYKIPKIKFVWNDNDFRKLGLCSAEEAQLTAKFLKDENNECQILTCISHSQFSRYFLHQKGYGIESVYYVFPDNPTYYHLKNNDQEKILMEITKKDPRWESDIGIKLRRFAHRLRDPNEPEVTQEEIQTLQTRLAEFVVE